MEKAVLGKRHVVRLALTCLLSEGHVLLEDFPGTGKTMLARALANTVQGSHARIQFTPDLLPSDVTGVTVYDQHKGTLRVPPRPDLPHDRAGRRDQPRLAQDAVGAARGDGGGPGHRRRRRAPGRQAVPRDRHPEPHRAGRHLPPARGAARPVPDEDLGRLPRPPGHRRAAQQRRRPRPRRPGHPGDHRRDHRADERPRRPGLRRPGRDRLRRRAGRGVAPPAARQARPVARAAAWPSSASPRPGPPPTVATTSSPTTSRTSPSRCSRTACSSTPRRSSAASTCRP